MKLKLVAIAMLLSTMEFAVNCFPGLSQTELKEKEQIEKTEPNFYH